LRISPNPARISSRKAPDLALEDLSGNRRFFEDGDSRLQVTAAAAAVLRFAVHGRGRKSTTPASDTVGGKLRRTSRFSASAVVAMAVC
jgi:hypothetical protein